MFFDDIFDEIGEFGRYQIKILLMVMFPTIGGTLGVVMVFTHAVPKYRCAVPWLENDTYAITSASHEEAVNRSIPWEKDDEKWIRSKTLVYTSPLMNNTEECTSWVFDKSTFESTIVTDFNLVSKKGKYILSILGATFMLGLFISGIVNGVLSDRYGRKKVIFFSIVMELVVGIATAFCPEPISYGILKVIAACTGAFVTAFTYSMEIVGPTKRAKAGVFVFLFYLAGYLLLVFFAYFIRNWQNLQIAICVPALFFLPLFWFVPESPRWLISKGRKVEAEKILRTIAEKNGRTFPKNIMDEIKLDTESESIPIKKLLKSTTLMCRIVNIFFSWFACAMTYYGLALNAGNIGGNIYVNNLLSALVEIPASFFCAFFLDKLSRKKSFCANMILTGSTLVGAVFVVQFGSNVNWALILCNMIGKFSISLAFSIIYVYTAEMYPTPFRNSVTGLSSTIARLGSILSPVVVTLGQFMDGRLKQTFPLIIFGSIPMIAGLMALALPETKGKYLPDTIEDAKRLRKKRYVPADESDVHLQMKIMKG